MTERRVTTFRIDEDLLRGLQEVWQRDGIQPSEQVRRALMDWLKKKRVSLYAQKAAWDDWMESFWHAKDKASVRIPEEACPALGGRIVGELNKREVEQLRRTATLLGRKPHLNILRATVTTRQTVKRARGTRH